MYDIFLSSLVITEININETLVKFPCYFLQICNRICICHLKCKILNPSIFYIEMKWCLLNYSPKACFLKVVSIMRPNFKYYLPVPSQMVRLYASKSFLCLFNCALPYDLLGRDQISSSLMAGMVTPSLPGPSRWCALSC